MKLSPFWKKPNFSYNEKVVVRRLGPSHEGKEYRGHIRGYYACDVEGNPDCYIVEMIDKIPGYEPGSALDQMTCHVFPRGCVDSVKDLTLRDEHCLPTT